MTEYDLADIVETWAAEKELSKEMEEFLWREHEANLSELVVSPPIAGGMYCSELDLPQGSTWPEVVAALLDALTGRPTEERLIEVREALGLDHCES